VLCAEVVPRWSRGGPGVVCHPHWAIPICKKSSSHSNIEHYKTSRTCTKTTLRITKRAGASPQQCCKAQNEQELHHSNIASFKQIKHRKCVYHIHNCAIGCFRVANVWFGHIRNVSRMEYEQEPHHSNVANYKTKRACTPATLWITKRAGSSPQQHCEIQNVRELHHSNIVNYKTNKSFTTSRLWITKRAGATPQQHNKGECLRELHHSNIVNQKGTRWLDTLWICSTWNLIWTHFEFISK